MTAPRKHPLRLRVAHLNPRVETPFLLQPDAETRAGIAAEMGLIGLPRLEFSGHLRATGGDGWRLEGRLVARVTQSCVVTLKPVRSVIDEPVLRIYSPHLTLPEESEIESPDDALEHLGQFIDISAVMIEQLTLALPEYPRAEGAGLDSAAQDDPDPAPDTRRPFAGLDQLIRKHD